MRINYQCNDAEFAIPIFFVLGTHRYRIDSSQLGNRQQSKNTYGAEPIKKRK